jgi:Family of unknown function (DUF6356)
MAQALIDRYFLAHPRTAGQGYFEHMKFAWRFAGALFGAAFAALIHGAFPCVFGTSASQTVRRLHGQIESRHVPSTSLN